jgi:uncharacterized protein (DUF2147 family)
MSFTSISVGAKYVRVTAFLGFTLFAAPCLANPIGDWMVEKGLARITIVNCDNKYWGVVSWEKEPALDTHNPDPAKRARPTLGMPVILDMRQTESNRWDGQIYNSNNGKTYAANLSMAGADALRVRGCVLGVLCGGETWTRVKADPPPAPQQRATTATNAAAAAAAAAATQAICAQVSGKPTP